MKGGKVGVLQDSPGRGTTARMIRYLIVLLPFAIVAAALVFHAVRGRRRSGRASVVESPYRNARPGAAYVGDSACARCHAEIAATYRQHPMGRSLSPIHAASPELRGAESPRDLFSAEGFTYAVVRHGDRTYHRETRRDERGQIIARVEAEVSAVLGSGTRALAFLVERDGHLFESPITWYAQRRRWDLSPGFDVANAHFERPVSAACLFCHANRVEPVPGTVNRFRPPTFRGHAIGCERCHGPGEAHARNPFDVAEGPNIVNPADLEPSLREAVCQQCHLMGADSIDRYGREPFDYRPGLPLHRFKTVFVRPSDHNGAHRNVGHVAQMYASRCFRDSRGRLGCISCHDPHDRPEPARRASYYRERCLNCHADRGCTLPEAERLAREPDDRCIACHMPRAAISDIPHTALTIHSIPRRPPAPDSTDETTGPARPDDLRLVPFHRDLMGPEEREAVRRDLGIALHVRGPQGADRSLPLLKAARAAHPDDLDAREAEGQALGTLGRAADGLAVLESVLKDAPDRESARVNAALLAGRSDATDRAIEHWQRAITLNPLPSAYHASLALQLNRAGRWAEAIDASRRALRLNPSSLPAWMALIEAEARSGSPDRARADYNRMLEFDPPDPAGLARWFGTLGPGPSPAIDPGRKLQ